MFKQLCNAHKQAIIGFADEIPICSSCDTAKYWVLESSQQNCFDLYQTQQYAHQKQKLPILKMKRKLQILIQTFQVFENHFINQLERLQSMYLDKVFNSLIAEEMIKNIDIIQSVLEQLQHLVKHSNDEKISKIVFPKLSKLMKIDTKIIQQDHKPQENNLQVQVKEHNRKDQKDNIALLQEQLNEAHQEKFQLGLYGFQEEDIAERLKHIKYINIQISENEFYQTIKSNYIQKPLFDDIMSSKLCIELAPKELLQMNRKTNFCTNLVDNEFWVSGYAQKNMLNGRGMVYSKWYYENGYYIDGLLVWGQISLIQNNIIQRFDIVNYDSVQVVKQIAGYSLMWNKYHVEILTNK